MKRLPTLFLSLLAGTAAHAVTLTFNSPAINPIEITHEIGGSSGTAVSFTIDLPGRVTMAVARVQNFGDSGTAVASVTTEFATPGAKTMFWDALWLINGDYARQNGKYQFTLTVSTGGASDTETSSTLAILNSVDIHNIEIAPTLDSVGQPTFPFGVAYDLAKEANTYIRIYNSSNTLVRTLVGGDLRAGEAQTRQTDVWDGLNDAGGRVPTGPYTVKLDATDAGNESAAITRISTMSLVSLAGGGSDAQAQFENNIFVYPNPIRDGFGTFQVQAARGGARMTLKIYTLNGDLVKEHDFGAVSVGVVHEYLWNTTNDAGNKVGRGLYYYVVREEDSSGTLQITKKLAVIK